MLAWKFEAEQMCRFSRAEFITGILSQNLLQVNQNFHSVWCSTKSSCTNFNSADFPGCRALKTDSCRGLQVRKMLKMPVKRKSCTVAKCPVSQFIHFSLGIFLANIYRLLLGSATRGCEFGFGRSRQVQRSLPLHIQGEW